MYSVKLFEEICVGCRSCMVACQAVRGLTEGTTPLIIAIREEETAGGGLRLRFTAKACRHCENAACAAACPAGAIVQEESGRVVIHEKECLNCGACVEACPYGALFLDPGHKAAVKCDLCAARVEAKLAPACVAACPGKAIYSGKADQITEEIARRKKGLQEARRRVDAEAEVYRSK